MVARTTTSINSLTRYLLFEIFARLPAEFILRLRDVKESWNRIVTSREFKRFHLERVNNSAPDQIIVRVETGFSLVSSDTFDLNRTIRLPRIMNCDDVYWPNLYGFTVYGSCNGLLCISLPQGQFVSCPIFLYNPSIRKYLKLPPGDLENPWDEICDPEKKILTLGLGFYEDDYNVVRLLNTCNGFLAFEVYSLISQSWTPIYPGMPDDLSEDDLGEDVIFLSKDAHFMDGCACLDGVIYWILVEDRNNVLLSFDMDTKILQKQPLPAELSGASLMGPNGLQVLLPTYPQAGHPMSLEVREKSLSLFQKRQQDNGRYCDIWIQNEENWERIHRIHLEVNRLIAWPLGFDRSGSIVHMIDEDSYQLRQFVPQQELLQGNHVQVCQADWFGDWFVDAHRESLVLMDVSTDDDDDDDDE